jgi:hypothetical protein
VSSDKPGLAIHMLIIHSLSEYGCNKGKREFNEVASIYGSDMSAVYSGGLVYEYSQEDSNYGLVKLSNGKVSEMDDFTTLKNAFSKTPLPSGDGGYNANGKASECPTKSNTWNVTMSANQLPAFPKDAQKFLKEGSGTGPGLKGAGSQDSGSSTTDLAGEADGAVTSGSSSSGAAPSKGAAASIRPEFGFAPIVCGAIVLVSTMLGGALVL